MGCDIHVYPEYAGFEKDGGGTHWSPLASECHPGRDYDLFSKLAGLRGDEGNQMIPTRGMPDDAAYESKSANELYIVDGPTDNEGYCTREQAESWIEHGSQYTDERKLFVTHPDHHSHSWCTAAEFRAVLEAPRKWAIDEPYWGLLAMLEEIERRGKATRLVFWFDN